MKLFADRIGLLGTENAFKLGPRIRAIEKRQLDANNTHYCDPQGLISFRKAIAKYVGAKRDLKVKPEHVVVFPGAKPPIGLCQQAYVDAGDEVIYPSPGFPIYESFTRYTNVKPVPMHLDEAKGFSLTGAEVEPLITAKTKLIYINFPSNPTGGVASREQLQEIADVIQRKCDSGVRVYSDEVYEEILFDGNRHVSIASMKGMQDRTIIVSGHSKSFSFTGGRIGYAVFPTEAEAEVFKNLNINYFSCVPPFIQEACREALESPKREAAIGAMVKTFQTRRDLVVDGLNQIPGIHCHRPMGAFYVFPNVEGACRCLGIVNRYEELSPEARLRSSPAGLFQGFLLDRYHVATLDRKSFGAIGSEGKHYLRISTATATEDLQEAVVRIKTAASDRAGFDSYFVTVRDRL
ncbi:MAG: aminotransferase class I/II-fold pyridoxal phosphate-dependent enzyme [Candidatus Riflebacteria bacterium]|nr:aminotransferase class I/II-fold pyridoxal phosphate-dependent enzyme [Candidatus Riflebacteria bacterium]